ncbi:protein FAR-RED ELONGATED HYPOCOTYL 1 [Rhododendron vialii]|uniref:protein FAR-RED ELONGATED HYPOCOTYL 1 n=1 Tax=Rhododendron vialii TaxID=182163 RepID=UPI00265F1589|nr:protein FAR-RED ELONGATED HYPOCOTYL 1 [Rhododendron vialii]
MEEENLDPSDINRVNVDKVVESYSGIFYLTKKRKFHAETLGLPLPKHKCSDSSFSSDIVSPLNKNPRVDDVDAHIIKGKIIVVAKDDEPEMGKIIIVAKDDEPEIVSGKDSNSYGGDSDSTMSSAEAKIQLEYPKMLLSDMPSTSSVNWASSSFKNSLYSLDSRIVSKSGADRVQSQCSGDNSFPHNDFGLNSCQNFDEHVQEFGCQIDYSCLEDENDYSETCTDKEPRSSNYVLSSGRWSINRETQPTAKKLTIDKEFEEYFSMLMM